MNNKDFNKYIDKCMVYKSTDSEKVNTLYFDFNLYLKLKKEVSNTDKSILINFKFIEAMLNRKIINPSRDDETFNIILKSINQFQMYNDYNYLYKFYKIFVDFLTEEEIYTIENFMINLPRYLSYNWVDFHPRNVKVANFNIYYKLRNFSTLDQISNLSLTNNDFDPSSIVDWDFFLHHISIIYHSKFGNQLINYILEHRDLNFYKNEYEFIDIIMNVKKMKVDNQKLEALVKIFKDTFTDSKYLKTLEKLL